MKTIKQLCKEYIYNKKDIPEIIRILRLIRTEEMPNNCSVMSGMPHASGVSDPTGRTAVNIITKEEKISALLKNKLLDIRKVDSLIRQLSEIEQRIMTGVVKQGKRPIDAYKDMLDIYSEYNTFFKAYSRLMDRLEDEEKTRQDKLISEI